jgi:hypothetical protein
MLLPWCLVLHSQHQFAHVVLYKRGYAVVLQVAHLLILANVESNNNTIVATIALKVT